MLTALFEFGARYRLPTLLFLFSITVALAPGLMRLKVDTSFDSLISASDPTKPTHDRIREEFGSDNTTIVYVRDPDLWTPERLRALGRLHDRLAGLPFVQKVESLYSARSIKAVDGAVESTIVIPDPPETRQDAAAARARALHSPLIAGMLASHDGTVTALNVSIVKSDPSDTGFDDHAEAEIGKALDEARDNFAEIFQVGPPRVNAELKRSMFEDMRLLLPLSLLVLVCVNGLFLRNFAAVYLPIVTGALSLIWAFGAMGLLGLPVNILSVMLPALVLVIGSTEDTHMIAAYLQGVSQHQRDVTLRSWQVRQAASRFMARHMGLPVLLTTLTTVLGFLSNGNADIALIREFSLAAALALALNGLATALAVPMILRTLGSSRTSVVTDKREPTGIARWIVSGFNVLWHRFGALTGFMVLVVVSFFFVHLLEIRVSNDPLSYFKPDQPLVQQVEKVHRDLAGVEVFTITVESQEAHAFKHPRNLRQLVEIQAFIKRQGAFDASLSLADQLALVNREFHGGAAYMHRVPDTRALVEQYLLFFQRDDLERYVSHDYRRATITVRHNIHDSHALKQALAELEWEIDGILDIELTYALTGQNILVNRAADILLEAQIESLGLLLLAVFLMFSALFTSFRGGFIAMVPNLIPIIITFGTLGLLGIPINPGTATVAAIAIGIAVDDTIHLLTLYNEECRKTPDRLLAVRRTVAAEAIPVISTSIALTAGFLVLLASNFSIVAQFGALAALTMILAMLSELVVTPLLLRHVRLVGLYDILAFNLGRGVLAGSPLFAGMSSFEIRKAVLLAEVREFKAGEPILTRGGQGSDLHLVLEGAVRVGRAMPTGMADGPRLAPGDVFGEIGFLGEGRRTADVTAESDGRMLVFHEDTLENCLRLYPRIAAKLVFNLSRILSIRVASMDQGGLATIPVRRMTTTGKEAPPDAAPAPA